MEVVAEDWTDHSVLQCLMGTWSSKHAQTPRAILLTLVWPERDPPHALALGREETAEYQCLSPR